MRAAYRALSKIFHSARSFAQRFSCSKFELRGWRADDHHRSCFSRATFATGERFKSVWRRTRKFSFPFSQRSYARLHSQQISPRV